jgi:hypothetical protein
MVEKINHYAKLVGMEDYLAKNHINFQVDKNNVLQLLVHSLWNKTL